MTYTFTFFHSCIFLFYLLLSTPSRASSFSGFDATEASQLNYKRHLTLFHGYDCPVCGVISHQQPLSKLRKMKRILFYEMF
ncbi:hypothetical protein RYX36_002390, partial [Vicia faba]